MKKKKKKGFTLIELLVVVAIIALLISILLPSLSRARELSKRLVCGSNVKGLGTAFKIYANDNEENWPTPPFDDSGGTTIVAYRHVGSPLTFGVGWPIMGTGDPPGRVTESDAGTTQLTVTRALWMLVRAGDVTPKQFVCPSSGDSPDPEQNIDLYYDFTAYKYISYGYQVPYGKFDSRASENVDSRLAVGADKGLYSDPSAPHLAPTANDDPDGSTRIPDWSPQDWRKFNSPNHGGPGSGEGQNVLYGDGHATFQKKPTCGVDEDNIFTRIDLSAGNDFDYQRMGGKTPNDSGVESWYPGRWSFGANKDCITDSLIYP